LSVARPGRAPTVKRLGTASVVFGPFAKPLVAIAPLSLAYCALAGLGCDPAPPPPRPNIVIVTLDTTRADHLGSYGYARAQTPNLDALAAAGVRFSRAWTVSNNTLPAHISILSGLHPQRTGVPRNGHKLAATVPWLPSSLQAAGYETAAFVSASALSGELGLSRGFDLFDDSFDVKELDQRQRHGDATTAAAQAWLAGPHDRPFLLWVHYFDPHYPYTPPAPYDALYGADYAGPADGSLPYLLSVWGRGGVEKVATTAADRQRLIDLYDGEIAWLDHNLGQLFAAVDAGGRDKDTLLFVTADHGESLDDHGYLFDHGEYLYEPTLHVPLIIRPPTRLGVRPAVVTTPVQNMDVAPTAMAFAGLAPKPGPGGRDLSAVLGSGGSLAPDATIFAESCRPWGIEKSHAGEYRNLHKATAARTGDLKLIATPFQGRVEVYDLQVDPGEMDDVFQDRAIEATALGGAIEVWRGDRVNIDMPDLENQESLRALGYVE
jgi:arylsulfatase A-like enzyme